MNVSVFETTIRILGGLLSAHMYDCPECIYNDGLLLLAIDLADRLLPAFETSTGIPYGTVNLRHGIPKAETKIACTAGAGSLLLEFAALTKLTGNSAYYNRAREAVKAIVSRKSKIGLVGKHINVETGVWTERVSSIGPNIDSFYEYLLKAYIYTQDDELWEWFIDAYKAVNRHLKMGDWYVDTLLDSGKPTIIAFNNLQAFWPGLQVLVGDISAATKTLNAFHTIQRHESKRYPLRPELAESTYLVYAATGDRSWLSAGKSMLLSLEDLVTSCGVASVENVASGDLEDAQPSFFLSETLKYLYLLFNAQESSFQPFPYEAIFTTEAHILPVQFFNISRYIKKLHRKNMSFCCEYSFIWKRLKR
eukprot:GSMAST32.ASY1.ANO1.141.1 assembled CDS